MLPRVIGWIGSLKRLGAMRLAYDACRRSGNQPGSPWGRLPGSPWGRVGSPLVGVAPELTVGALCARKRTQGSARGSASLLAPADGSHTCWVGGPAGRVRRRNAPPWHGGGGGAFAGSFALAAISAE
jgi:hypothetical protein